MKHKESGYTMAELLVAGLLLAFGVLAAAPMFMHAMQGNAAGGAIGSVSVAAEQRLEQLRSMGYAQLQPGGNVKVAVTGYSDYPEPDILVTWMVLNNLSPAGTKILVVRASQLGNGPGPERQVDLIAMRGR